ncbi:MAG: hypothetical protein AB7W37_13660 [Syntrophobacteraceae bacterium]
MMTHEHHIRLNCRFKFQATRSVCALVVESAIIANNSFHFTAALFVNPECLHPRKRIIAHLTGILTWITS